MKSVKSNYSVILYALLAVIVLILHYVFELDVFSPWEKYLPFFKKLSLSLFFIFIILLIGKIIKKYIEIHANTEGDRYNLLRISSFISIILILIVVASFLFQNLYATAVSFGLISLILGFALQAPITSFIAWLYIVFRHPYKVGHRIQINGMRGDVEEINFLDTKMVECSGDYLQNDRKSGRTIFFPNSLILKEVVINYSGPQLPFIWNETALQIAYTSDLSFVKTCLIEASKRDFSTLYTEYRDDIPEQWKPEVYFRINTFAWLEAVISYPVEPQDTTGRRTRILQYALPLLNASPDKVQFPEGTSR